MTFRRLLLVLLVASAVLAPVAQAKGPFMVCGTTCALLAAEEAGPPVPIGMVTGATTVGPAAPAPYFVIRFRDIPGPLAYWIPSSSIIRVRSGAGSAAWLGATPEQAALLEEKTAGLVPKRTPTVQQAAVDRSLARGARSYLSLYTVGTPVPRARGAGGWLIVNIWGAQTPWTDGTNALRVSRRGGFLIRDGQLVRIPLALARQIRAGQPLRATTHVGG